MNENGKIPVSLKIVAVLFILGGVSAAIEIVVSLMHGRVNINFGVLGLFIGPGLLALKRGWRTCGLVFLWIGMIFAPIIGVLMLIQSGPVYFHLFGQRAGDTSKAIGLIVVVAVFLLCFWQYRVLTRPDVRRLFGLE